ncbi:hypothetical protein F8388_010733 [Cannabis sativa]|uniref:Peptidase C1A papain C-terminal domain-containing protein n=1 Tax=Cannabis sativa TaxID=3483 RepID=A0A7J6DM11_CANSA|nr:hypothetical protein G4B88_030233 [Cannabis sativa]KAF4378294.1 hypothetical protein F8388_010733 [Cannabis sativa]
MGHIRPPSAQPLMASPSSKSHDLATPLFFSPDLIAPSAPLFLGVCLFVLTYGFMFEFRWMILIMVGSGSDGGGGKSSYEDEDGDEEFPAETSWAYSIGEFIETHLYKTCTLRIKLCVDELINNSKLHESTCPILSAFLYIINHGIAFKDDYSFTASTQVFSRRIYPLKDYRVLGSIELIEQVISKEGNTVIMIFHLSESFQNWQSWDIFNPDDYNDGTSKPYIMKCEAFGNERGENPYWIVRNVCKTDNWGRGDGSGRIAKLMPSVAYVPVFAEYIPTR